MFVTPFEYLKAKIRNSNIEIRNNFRIPKIQMSEIRLRRTKLNCFEHLIIRASDLFRILYFVLRIFRLVRVRISELFFANSSENFTDPFEQRGAFDRLLDIIIHIELHAGFQLVAALADACLNRAKDDDRHTAILGVPRVFEGFAHFKAVHSGHEEIKNE